MDQETLTNHISKLGKSYFETACKIVLRDIFNFHVINVDGKNDGGTDFSELDNFGKRTKVAYQITTQKTDIKNKAYKDAKKSIEKLGIEKFYFLCTYILSETDGRLLESKISEELKIQSVCFSANTIAALILSENKLNAFLSETNSYIPIPKLNDSFNYREMALHSYTLLSNDSNQLKDNIYDDTILFILSGKPDGFDENEIILGVKDLLELSDGKNDILKRRIGALFGKQKLIKNDFDKIVLNQNAKTDIENRKEIYSRELSNLVAAQTDLLREYNIDWNIADSKTISIWIADTFVSKQIANLKEIKASIVSHPIFNNFDDTGIDKLKAYLRKNKKVNKDELLNKITEDLIRLASTHPLITKIIRASMYLALQGTDPINSAKSFGANRWSDFNILLEPTSAIPYICSTLYSGCVNQYFDNSVHSINRAKKLDSKLFIPYFYINECAGHLLHARKYCGLDLNEDELIHSGNAFVSNYYALKKAGTRVPDNLLEYLSTYSSAIKTEKIDIKNWIREIMTDIQSILNKSGIEFINVPYYEGDSCKYFEEEYTYLLRELNIDKQTHLTNHDIWALQFTNDLILNEGEHWIILTYDKSLISIGNSSNYKGWITTPIKFLDITESCKSLSENKFISLIHTVATYSEQTLSIGARIIDRIVLFASKEMGNWEFKQDIEKFKSQYIKSILNSNLDIFQIDRKTDEFLKGKGINIEINEEVLIDE
ncbi:MAG: hypothetical protein EOM29_06870 [Bacteroidia bacterium]|nr:hypothetical protein [Bacteroidia bacterium]